MEMMNIKNQAICILTLDGGIPGTTKLSQLIIVQLIMRTFQEKTENRVDIDEDNEIRPSEIFDFICGSGMGGVFAILFNIFQYTANAAIEFYLELHERVFSTQAWTQRTRSENASLLKNAILQLLPLDMLEREFMTASEPGSHLFICAANSKNHAHARLLRTYKSRENPLCVPFLTQSFSPLPMKTTLIHTPWVDSRNFSPVLATETAIPLNTLSGRFVLSSTTTQWCHV
ncbi:hypothetical protein DL96DRAFT_891436 [Flagelloscypha sp. PMI_526]|nr:hypothetical protein DL96DRAFT_891436 [Flagelloscypha sp. PMI_526]